METINLTIPDMKSTHCQMTVKNTVTGLGGHVTATAPAKAEIVLNNGLTKDAVILAIRKAGYNVIN